MAHAFIQIDMPMPEHLLASDAQQDSGPGHLGLVPRCGACMDTIFRHERIIALLGDELSSSYRERTRPFPFPQVGYSDTRVSGYRLCRYPACTTCARSPECVPVHYDCLVIFMRESPLTEREALARLWAVGCYRNPWPKAPSLNIAPRPPADREAELRIGRTCGLSKLCRLPPELVELVWEPTPHSLFWRAIFTVSLAKHITSPPQPLHTLALRDVGTWRRGGVPSSSCGAGRCQSVMRLTIDMCGILQIDRLPARPEYRPGGKSGCNSYIVETVDVLSGVQAQLKNNCLRLILPAKLPALRVWDTPTPPALGNCFFSRQPAGMSWQNFRTVDFAAVQGITFFYSSGRLSGVHLHDSARSCALSTFQRLKNRRQKGAVWIYWPIARNDSVVALGVRGVFDIFIRSRLAGDVIIGSRFYRYAPDGWLGNSGKQCTLIYGEPRDGEAVPFVGGYCTARTPLPDVRRPRPKLENDRGMHFSTAPLDHVAAASVWYDEENGFCRGILLEYENGGLRTVGQCRLHVDPRKTYVRPSVLRFQMGMQPTQDGREIHGIRIAFESGQSGREHAVDGGWQYKALEGTLMFWFSNWRSLLSIVY